MWIVYQFGITLRSLEMSLDGLGLDKLNVMSDDFFFGLTTLIKDDGRLALVRFSIPKLQKK
jgi:hypothetical protein